MYPNTNLKYSTAGRTLNIIGPWGSHSVSSMSASVEHVLEDTLVCQWEKPTAVTRLMITYSSV